MINAMISVRAASTRLPNKCFLNIYGTSIIKHVIDRCLDNGFDPVVATTTADQTIVGMCKLGKIRCYAGSDEDKLDRWLQACREFHVESFITVDCDDPLFEPSLSHEQHILLDDKDIDVVAPDLNAYLGSHGWAMRTSALEEMCAKKRSNATEMIWHHFPSDLKIKQFDAHPSPVEKDLRLTLDYVEDYTLISTVIRELGFRCTRAEIVSLFEKYPGLRIVNEFRNPEWRARQEGSR